jgi:hypothetical protein
MQNQPNQTLLPQLLVNAWRSTKTYQRMIKTLRRQNKALELGREVKSESTPELMKKDELIEELRAQVHQLRE